MRIQGIAQHLLGLLLCQTLLLRSEECSTPSQHSNAMQTSFIKASKVKAVLVDIGDVAIAIGRSSSFGISSKLEEHDSMPKVQLQTIVEIDLTNEVLVFPC